MDKGKVVEKAAGKMEKGKVEEKATEKMDKWKVDRTALPNKAFFPYTQRKNK